MHRNDKIQSPKGKNPDLKKQEREIYRNEGIRRFRIQRNETTTSEVQSNEQVRPQVYKDTAGSLGNPSEHFGKRTLTGTEPYGKGTKKRASEEE